MKDFKIKDSYKFDDLLEIIKVLRAPGGCPWDGEQTHESIRRNFIEETYEAIEAIDNGDIDLLKEELGDVLLQVVFHTEMEAEKNVFDIDDVCDGVCKKLIYRHPHIFSDVEVSGTTEVLQNWEALKKIEKKQTTTTQSMEAVAKSLPQLIRADKVQGKAAKVGFDWDTIDCALEKVHEEADEITKALNGDGDVGDEIGDLLFAAVNVSRFAKKDPEQMLENSCNKFIKRFSFVEEAVLKSGKEWNEFTLEQLDEFWNQAKEIDKN